MLRELQITNLAIIEKLHVEFAPGLNILTGETGAGKSIIIDAVNLILGGRASSDLIRSGAKEASVEAVFDLEGREALLAALAEAGVECEGELLVRRVVQQGGKNRVFIGGGLATTSVLSELSRNLINIYGQHDAQTLLKTENHLRLLDGFAGALSLREEFASRFEAYQAAKNELAALEQGEREAERRLDLLSFQSGEIADAKLHAGEEEELAEERLRLSHSGKLLSASQQAFETLYGGDAALLGALRRMIGTVAEAGSLDHALAPVADTLEAAYAQLEDAALTLRDYAASVEAEPGRLEQLEDRLDAINRLKRKYGADIDEILAYKGQVDAELAALGNREEAKGELQQRIAALEGELEVLGGKLSKMREKGASELKAGMERELSELAMKNSLFETSFERSSEARSYGFERCEFLFSPNPGEPPKPLAKIASGGELSRLMLALKQLHPDSEVPTLIFDEVDTGIGGATSALIGEKLKRVARSQQVLAITHLPQVAAFADLHLKVEKGVSAGRTATSVEYLDPEARVAEIARMLAGARVTEKTLEHAREMIQEAVR
ncbi:DNA repair protein RecN [Citrifermentans bremense]|uniref:DNA repair protein RecN n=1 Tax=Citrifermentans bremense TaxID=60035 RepID=A0A6S6M7Q3_9BACT|nr:DNA repair protein RecN [Citrifermentans bremense]BCG47541.1 DNA repair protein RecN [Citrifermentans bremense]